MRNSNQDSTRSEGSLCGLFCSAKEINLDDDKPQRSLFNLQRSGSQGCPNCQLLYEACKALHPSLVENAAWVEVHVFVSHGHLTMHFDSIREPSINIEGYFPPPNLEIHLNYVYNTTTPDWKALTPRRKLLNCREEQFSGLLLDWLDDCERNHVACRRTEKELPTRVLHVGDEMGKEPYLYISKGEKERYVALSHCWGEVLLIKTEKSSLSTRQAGIPFDSLPKNFRDAIRVAQAIGVEYIWIDSLCILQDDVVDWDIQSSKMASIYENAHAVLVASNSADSQGGLWNASWDSYTQENEIYKLPHVNRDGSTSQIIARKTMTHEDYIPETYLQYAALSPLSTRAWTLQEELLAWRCIFFSGKEILWKCQSATKCECMQEDIEDTQKHVDRQERLWDSAKSQSDDPALRFGKWRSLMAYYSKRSITYESDRLPAISGMAKYMQGKGAGQYLAGMWKEDLLESLLWLPQPVWRSVTHDNLASTYRRRASPYRAPSWSWISLETYGDGKDKSVCPGIVDWQEGRHWFLERTHAKVIDASCEPLGVDPTGAIKSAYIVLQSKCIEALVEWETRHSQIVYGKMPLSVHWDLDLEFGMRQKVYCLLIGDTVTDEDTRARRPIKALVLRRSKYVAGAFERVGICAEDNFQGKKFDLFGKAKEEFMTIV